MVLQSERQTKPFILRPQNGEKILLESKLLFSCCSSWSQLSSRVALHFNCSDSRLVSWSRQVKWQSSIREDYIKIAFKRQKTNPHLCVELSFGEL